MWASRQLAFSKRTADKLVSIGRDLGRSELLYRSEDSSCLQRTKKERTPMKLNYFSSFLKIRPSLWPI